MLKFIEKIKEKRQIKEYERKMILKRIEDVKEEERIERKEEEKRERFLKLKDSLTFEQVEKEIDGHIDGFEDWWQYSKTVIRPTDEEIRKAMKTGEIVLKVKRKEKNLNVISVSIVDD